MDQLPRTAVKGPLTEREILSILVGILLAMFLAALDQTIIATALPTIGRELGDPEHLPWVVTSYLLTSTAVTPLYGKFSDSHGRRITLLIAIAVFIVGSIACALAPSMILLVLARGLQGLGGGGLIALGQTIIADLVSPKERARYQVYFAAVFLTSSVLGPVLGGFMAEHIHWSFIFWINVPLGLGALALSNRSLKRLPRHDRRRELDFLGAGLLMAATVLILLALSWGGLHFPWLSIQVAALAVFSALFWMLFAWRMRTAREPLIPADILHNPVVRAGTLAACFGMGSFIGLTIYIPIYFETVRGLSASSSGLALIPFMLGTIVGANLSGSMMARVKHYKRLPMAGLAVATLSTACVALFGQDLSIAALQALLALMSVGLGTLLPVSTVSVQNSVEPHQMGTATASMSFFRSLGGAFIVAIYGAIVIGGTGLSGASLSHEALGPAAARSGVDLAGVFRWVFAAAFVGFVLALLFLWRMEERPLRSRVGSDRPQ
jgi:EmrB/QacA subfamily drug resistance transporter